MSYSTNNSTAIAVTNFGVKIDGITDNRATLQSAIDSVSSKGGGGLYFPAGQCYWSGAVNVTGRNMSFISDGNAVLRGANNEASKKFNVSGAQNISFRNLTCDGGRTNSSSSTSNQLGFISTVNSSNISVEDCRFFNTLNSMIYLGGGTRFVDVKNNYFTGHFCGVYGYINSGESGSEAFCIDGNKFGSSWTAGEGESACIKLQTSPSQSNKSRGHVVSNNVIDSTTQMGVELWFGGRDIVVSNNTIENTVWGISLDNQENISVVGNTVKACSYAGIEMASYTKNSIIANNNINGYLSNSTGNLSRLTSYAVVVSNSTCENNTIIGNNIAGAGYGVLLQNAINTNLSNNNIRDCDQSINFQGSSLNKVHNNLFDTGVFGTNYHMFFDAVSYTLSGFHITDNKFRGGTSQQSLFYYNNNGTGTTIRDLCIENNVTDSTTAGGYGIFIGGQLTPSNYIYRNNFGPSGADAGNSIVDAGDAGGGYGSPNIANGFQYYAHYDYTVPAASGITNDGLWVCLWSGGGGYQNNLRTRIYYDANIDGFLYDDIEIWANMVPYQSFYKAHSLMVTPNVSINIPSLFKQVKTLSHDVNATNSLWIRLGTVSVGANKLFHIYNSQVNRLTTPYATYSEPVDTASNANIRLDGNGYGGAYKFQYVNIGNQNGVFLNSPSSGVLGLTNTSTTPVKLAAGAPDNSLVLLSNGNVGIGTSPSATLHVNGSVRLDGITTTSSATSGGATALPALPAGYVTINIAGTNYKLPYFNS